MLRFRFLLATSAATAALILVSVVAAAGSISTGKAPNVNPRTTAVIDYAEPFDQHKPGHDNGNGKGPGGGGGGGGDGPDHSAGHFELIGGVWDDADGSNGVVDPKLDFVIDLRGFPTGSGQAILDAFDAWESQTAGDLFDETGSSFADTDVVIGDGVNTYSMRNLGGRVLAATFITWDDADNNGAIDTGETFLEMDIVHNFTVTWTTDDTSAGTKGKWFDVQGVANHEIGHAFGLAHPGSGHAEDEEQTMFASAGPKETKKRTLEADGDVPGIQSAALGYGATP
jgi:hypothetical protein